MDTCKCDASKAADPNSTLYAVRYFDSQGNPLFATCHHGEVVLDLRPESQRNPKPKTPEDGMSKKNHDAISLFKR